MSKNYSLISIIIIIFILGGFYFGYRKTLTDEPMANSSKTETDAHAVIVPDNGKPSTKTTSAPKSVVVKTKTAETPEISGTVITFTNEGFSPKQIEIKAGQSVRFINNSSLGMWVASNPHPTHEIYSELNEGKTVGRGGYYDFTFNKVGSWGYHNHVAPSKGGVVIVHVQ